MNSTGFNPLPASTDEERDPYRLWDCEEEPPWVEDLQFPLDDPDE